MYLPLAILPVGVGALPEDTVGACVVAGALEPPDEACDNPEEWDCEDLAVAADVDELGGEVDEGFAELAPVVARARFLGGIALPAAAMATRRGAK